MKDIVRDGDPVLRQVAAKIEFPLSKEMQQLALDMMTYLKNSQDPEIAQKHQLRPGVGLAAPQVGQSVAMASLLVPGANNEILFEDTFVNPVIIRNSVREAALAEGEGCLSVDKDVPGYVPRADKITVRYQKLSGETVEIRLKDYPAIVAQHEIDHLNGHLFYDHINQKAPFSLAHDDTVIIE